MHRSGTFKGLLSVLSVAGFAVIAYFITQGATLPFDTALQKAIFSVRSPELTAVVSAFTYTGNWQPITLLCVFLLLLPKTRRPYGLPMTFSALISVSLYETLKFIFQRPRPDAALRLISETGFSFPSGHALTSLIFWGTALLLLHSYAKAPPRTSEDTPAIVHISRKSTLGAVTVFLSLYILCMGLSRIYLGVHYPTDVLGSWCLGTCVLIALNETVTKKS